MSLLMTLISSDGQILIKSSNLKSFIKMI